ncbi:MAG: alpha/beta fold hydrolase [Acidimicrobiales bacterium]
MSGQAINLISVDGIELEIATSEPTATSQASGTPGDAPQILFLHGLGGDCRAFEAQLASLGERHRCAAWTMPGYGRSAALEDHNFATLADMAAAVIGQLGWLSPTVVGHSMGGYVAQELALRHPRSVGAVVLAGTTAAFGKPGSDFNRDFLAARLAPLDEGKTPADLAPQVAAGLLGPEAPAEAKQAAIDSMSAISAEAYRQALATLVTWDARDRLKDLQQPTLCIAGELDATAPPRSVERLNEAIANSRLTVIDGAGHLMYAEAPEIFTTAVAEFVSGLTRTESR